MSNNGSDLKYRSHSRFLDKTFGHLFKDKVGTSLVSIVIDPVSTVSGDEIVWKNMQYTYALCDIAADRIEQERKEDRPYEKPIHRGDLLWFIAGEEYKDLCPPQNQRVPVVTSVDVLYNQAQELADMLTVEAQDYIFNRRGYDQDVTNDPEFFERIDFDPRYEKLVDDIIKTAEFIRDNRPLVDRVERTKGIPRYPGKNKKIERTGRVINPSLAFQSDPITLACPLLAVSVMYSFCYIR